LEGAETYNLKIFVTVNIIIVNKLNINNIKIFT